MITRDQVATAVQAAIDGNASCLEVYALIKEFEKDITSFLDLAKEQVNLLAWEEAEKYPEKSFTAYGYKFEKREGRKIYKYDHISMWASTHERLKEIEGLAKSAADRGLIGKVIIDEVTGEVIQPAALSFANPVIVVKKY
jgi:undecaprenyl pyrophosphate synthase